MFYRINIHSDPVVQLHNPVVICTVCKEHGHTRRSCRYNDADNLVGMDQEDIAFWSYIHPRDRPECLGGVGSEPMEEDTADISNGESGEESEECDSDSEVSDYDYSEVSDVDSSD